MVRIEDLLARIKAVLDGEADIRWAYLFGSCARGGVGRDVDLAVMPTTDAYPGGVAWGRLIADLEEVAGSRVDLVDLRSAPLPLTGSMLSERVVLLDRERDARHEWEARTTARWLDFKPAFERSAEVRQAAMKARLRGAG